MTETALQYLIVCPLVFLGGLVDAVAGGGGLITLPAYLIAGLPAHLAIGTNKLSACMGTSLATWRFARKGYIPWKLALPCALFALAGSSAGARLTLLIDEGVFKLVMLAVLPLTGAYVLLGKPLRAELEPFSFRKTLLLSMAAALVIGVYDGFYGPGTGTFLLLLLTAAARMKLQEANGATKLINLFTNISALVVFLFSGNVLLPLGLAAGCFGIAGNYVGARFFERGGARSVKPLMVLVLAIFFVKVLLELLA